MASWQRKRQVQQFNVRFAIPEQPLTPPRQHAMSRFRFVVGFLIFAVAVTAVAAGPVAPPPPSEYKVHLRYRIRAGRNERLRQYFALTKFLESNGFQKEPG